MCVKDRIAILKQSKSNPQLLIDSDNKIGRACGHRLRFHKCAKQTTPTLMSQSMMNEPAQCMKPQQISLGAMFAQLMSNWKRCEDHQKEIVFYLFPKQFTINQSLFASVQHESVTVETPRKR